jgi:hypothetical protein
MSFKKTLLKIEILSVLPDNSSQRCIFPSYCTDNIIACNPGNPVPGIPGVPAIFWYRNPGTKIVAAPDFDTNILFIS